MRKRASPLGPMRLVVALAAAALLCAGAGAQERPRPGPEPRATGAAERCAGRVQGPTARLVPRLRRGFNLTGWLDADRVRPLPQETLERLRRLGFDHVRLPIDGEALTPSFSAGRAPARLAELDRALDALERAGFFVVLDLHPGARFQALNKLAPRAAVEDLSAAWATLSERLRRRPLDGLAYELLNEPTASPQIWAEQRARLIKELRAREPARTLIMGGAGAQRVDELIASTPLEDDNLVYATHFYDPFPFTHQGLFWEPGSPLARLRGVPFPLTPERLAASGAAARARAAGDGALAQDVEGWAARGADADAVAREMARLGAWAAKAGRHVTIGEFGVIRGAAEPADRLAWLAAVRRGAEAACLGWTHWEIRDAFGFLNADGTPDPGVVEALFGR